MAGNFGVMERLGGEADEVRRWVMLGEDLMGVLAFAEDVVDLSEAREVAFGEALLIGDEDI